MEHGCEVQRGATGRTDTEEETLRSENPSAVVVVMRRWGERSTVGDTDGLDSPSRHTLRAGFRRMCLQGLWLKNVFTPRASP